MEQIYMNMATILKAISDPKRLRIVDMLSCGELCACNILEAFQITQPTLSHDMRVLIKAGVVNSRREGKNTFYQLNLETLREFERMLHEITIPKDECICHIDGCAC